MFEEVTVASRVVAVWNRREVLGLLIRRDLKVKYQQSALGYLWTLIQPLLMSGVYFFVFGVLFKGARTTPPGDATYILYLVSGYLAWMWFNSCANESTKALKSQAKLITTMKVPREIFAIGVVGGKLVEYVFSLPVLLLFIFVGHGSFTVRMLLIPVSMALMLVLTTGLTLLLSALNVVLRDVERIIGVLLRVLLYMSPVLYTVAKVKDKLPGTLQRVYEANPLVGILQLQHAAFFPTEMPSVGLLATSATGCVLIFLFGWWVFRRLEPSVLKEL